VVLNLWACGHFDAVFAASNVRPVLAGRAAREAIWILDERGDREQVPVDDLIRCARIEVWNAIDDELDLMLDLATTLGDGEAESIAIARSRGMRLVTDDRPARNAARRTKPPVALLSTSELMRAWASPQEPDIIAKAVERIEVGASFRPPRVDPNAGWWSEHYRPHQSSR
jgi:hypothetical protein